MAEKEIPREGHGKEDSLKQISTLVHIARQENSAIQTCASEA